VHAENERVLAEILKPEQLKRLKQISYQRRGSNAFTDPDVAKAIQLTENQQKKTRARAWEFNPRERRRYRRPIRTGMLKGRRARLRAPPTASPRTGSHRKTNDANT
jgi:hypothetical protein